MVLNISLLNIFLSLVMFAYNWRVNRNSIFLCVMIISLASYSITHYFGISGISDFWLAVTFTIPAPLWYLTGPCLYFYIRGGLMDRFTFNKKDLWHLLPFAVTLVGILPYLFTSFDYKMDVAREIIRDINVAKQIRPNFIVPLWINVLLRPLQMIAYALAGMFMILKSQKTLSNSRYIPKNQLTSFRNWLLMLSGIILLIALTYLSISVYYVFVPDINRQHLDNMFLHNMTAFSLTLIPVTLIIFPQILYGIPRYHHPLPYPLDYTIGGNTEAKGMAEVAYAEETSPVTNYAAGRKIEEDPFVGLAERILKVMEEKKPYLDYDFNLEDLAKLLDVPKHHIYYCFRNILHTKFTRLRMDYRISHAKKILDDIDLKTTTIDSVGRSSGFPSRSGFFNTFKAEVGCSPSEYLENIKT